jgi:GntR family transcriptional regulator, rspAB operon transcriptional repressor
VPVSHSEKAYGLIKESIITLDLKPLAVIDEQVLMDSLKLGRTPIREALHRLAREDLVIIAPRRGMFVADISVTDLQKIFEMRILVEGYCAQLAAQRATDAQIAEMERVVVRLEQTPSTDIPELMSLDRRLHQMMYEAADNKFLADALNHLHALSVRLWYLAVDKLDDLKGSIEDHRPVIEALKARNGPEAELLIQRHITRFQQQIRTVI